MTYKRILVTGNEGYIGHIVVEKLVELGYFVVGLDSGVFRGVEFVPPKARPHVQIYKDIRDVESADVHNIDVIIHLAGLSNDPLGYLNPELTYEINHKASVGLAQLAKQKGVKRFLFSSSCSIYGVLSDELVNEKSALTPQTPYAISKIRTEEDLVQLADANFTPIFLRNATAFGISPRQRLDLVVSNLVAHSHVHGNINILSDGTPWRPVVHIRDIADAFLMLMECPKEIVHNEAFNVGHAENNLQIKAIAQLVKEMHPDSTITIKNENPVDNRSYRVDFSKIYALGFKPTYTLAKGIEEIVSVFQKASLKKEDLDSEKYITLKRYQHLLETNEIDNNLRYTHAIS